MENDNSDPIKSQEVKLEQVSEGKVNIKLSNEDKSFTAFYNPAQEFNRDMSVLAINTYFNYHKYRKQKEINKITTGEYKFSVCEPLSATGLRAIRYLKELNSEMVNEIYANDMDEKAVECINQNAARNNVDPKRFKVCTGDASQLLYLNLKHFDVIDLDPYGSAIPFLDSALQGAKNGALLCLTFTDMPVLCGNYPETTFYKYGSIPYKGSFCHEVAKRIALFAVSSCASKYKKVIKPLLCFNAEFYIRLFVIIKDSPEDCKNNPMKYGYMYHCRSCQNRSFSPLARMEEAKNERKKTSFKYVKFYNLVGDTHCNICGSFVCMTGPYWLEDVQDEDFINLLLDNLKLEEYKYLKYNKRIEIYLNAIKSELPLRKGIFNFDYAMFSRDVTLSSPRMSLFR